MTTSSKTISCRRCGEQAVWWATNKAGKYYLAVILPASVEYPHTTPIKRPHVCPTPEQMARRAEESAEFERKFWMAHFMREDRCVEPGPDHGFCAEPGNGAYICADCLIEKMPAIIAFQAKEAQR